MGKNVGSGVGDFVFTTVGRGVLGGGVKKRVGRGVFGAFVGEYVGEYVGDGEGAGVTSN